MDIGSGSGESQYGHLARDGLVGYAFLSCRFCYAEGTLFPWTMSDISLMDAIECGIVKLPRVQVADNIPGTEMPMYRDLWVHISKAMPKKRRRIDGALDPLDMPLQLQMALEALYGHYNKTHQLRQDRNINLLPCFIIVCNNTATPKLVYNYFSGIYPRPNLSIADKMRIVFPYLLRDVAITSVNHVWSTDITYIPMVKGFMYLAAVMDWYTRYVLSWELSNQ